MATNKPIRESEMSYYLGALREAYPSLLASLDAAALEDRLQSTADNLLWSGRPISFEDVLYTFLRSLEAKASADVVLAQRRLEAEYRSAAARRR
jgi:hypothetical protein